MARITLLLDQRNKKAERFPLVIRVSHKSKVKYLQTGYKLLKEEWNNKRLEKESESATVRAQEVITKRTKLVDFTKKVVNRYRKANRFGMAKGIEKGIHQILKHHGSNKLLLTEIDEIFLEDLEALVHTNYYTTEAYFEGFDKEVLDEAAEKILENEEL